LASVCSGGADTHINPVLGSGQRDRSEEQAEREHILHEKEVL
jgi:hypothetical protein